MIRSKRVLLPPSMTMWLLQDLVPKRNKKAIIVRNLRETHFSRHCTKSQQKVNDAFGYYQIKARKFRVWREQESVKLKERRSQKWKKSYLPVPHKVCLKRINIIFKTQSCHCPEQIIPINCLPLLLLTLITRPTGQKWETYFKKPNQIFQ